MVSSLPAQGPSELFTEEQDRVSFEDAADGAFEVLSDDNYPGQFRVVGWKIETVSEKSAEVFYYF